MALVDKQAAAYVKDAEAPGFLLKQAIELVNDNKRLNDLSNNILSLALPDSADIIAKEVITMI